MRPDEDAKEWLKKAGEDFDFASSILPDTTFADFLSPFYIDTRYPVHWPAAVTKEESLKALEAARKIKDFILKHIQK